MRRDSDGFARAGWVLRWLSTVRTRLRQRLDLLLEFIVLRHQLAVLQRTDTRELLLRKPAEKVSKRWLIRRLFAATFGFASSLSTSASRTSQDSVEFGPRLPVQPSLFFVDGSLPCPREADHPRPVQTTRRLRR
jgi:hypothetical protein